MQVAAALDDLHPRRLKFAERKIKQPRVVGLEAQYAVRFQQRLVELKECAVGQAALVMPCLRPRVAEIEIDAIKGVQREPLGEGLGIPDDKAEILRAHFLCHGALYCRDHHIRDALHRIEADLRVQRRHADRELALAAADLQMQRTLRAAERRRWVGKRDRFIGAKQIPGCCQPFAAVFFLLSSNF